MAALMPYQMLAAVVIGLLVLVIPQARAGAAEWLFGDDKHDD